MPKHKQERVRLLVLESDLNDAESLVSMMKSHGHAVRAKRLDTVDELAETLKKQSADLLLFTLDTGAARLTDVIDTVRQSGRHVPVIALTDADAAPGRVECMQEGAEDLVSKKDREHLILVIERVLRCRRLWRRTKRLEAALAESERRARALLDSSRDAIAYVHEGMHIYANPRYLELFGFSSMEDIEGVPLLDLVVPEHQTRLKEALKGDLRANPGPATLELRLRNIRDEAFDAQLELCPASMDGEPCTQLVIRSQGDARVLEERLREAQQRDALTGLYNRRYFLEKIEEAIHAAATGQRKAYLVLAELTNLGELRDRIGVGPTDLVLAEAAELLESLSLEGDVLGRMSEDVFAIVSTLQEREALTTHLQRIHQAFEEHTFDAEGKSVPVNLRFGAAPIDENTPELNELIRRAEQALHAPPPAEGVPLNIYVPKAGEMSQRELDEMWHKRLRAALKENRFQIMFQPIVSLHGEEQERFDVFLRLLDEKGQPVSPAEFLPSAERTGLATALDRWLLRAAIQKLAEARHADRDAQLFVKLTAGTLTDPDLSRWIVQELRSAKVPGNSLVLEFREAALIDHLRQARQLAQDLGALHCRFALEDFGAGIEPFNLLKAFPAEFLKVDRSLTEDIAERPDVAEGLREIVDRAHALNKLVIVQFVEDAATLQALWSLGINYVQGSFLQPPSLEMDYDFGTL